VDVAMGFDDLSLPGAPDDIALSSRGSTRERKKKVQVQLPHTTRAFPADEEAENLPPYKSLAVATEPFPGSVPPDGVDLPGGSDSDSIGSLGERTDWTSSPKPPKSPSRNRQLIFQPKGYTWGNRRTTCGAKPTRPLKSLSRNFLEKQKTAVTLFVTVCALFGLGVAFLEEKQCFATCTETDEIDYLGRIVCIPDEEVPETCSSWTLQATKGAVSLSTLVACAGLLYDYRLMARLKALDQHVKKNKAIRNNGIFQNGFGKWLILELLLLAVHCPPGVEKTISVEVTGLVATYRVEALAAGFMVSRLYHVGKLQRELTKATNKRFAGRIFDTPVGSLFEVKQLLFNQPVSLIFVVFVLFALPAAFLIRIAEAPVQSTLPGYYWNCAWFVVVTMTSTGYGEMNTLTHVGRFIATCAMVMGVVLTATLTAAVSAAFQFTIAEFQTLSFLQSHKWKLGRHKCAAKVIQAVAKTGRGSSRSKKACAAFAAHRRGYYAWCHSEPHFGKLGQDVVQVTQDTEKAMKDLSRIIHELKHFKVACQHEHGHAHQRQYGNLGLQTGRWGPEQPDHESVIEDDEDISDTERDEILAVIDGQRKIVEKILQGVFHFTKENATDVNETKAAISELLSCTEDIHPDDNSSRLHAD